jgi:hypothetical protein
MGVGAGGNMLLCQPSRCRPPLSDHELLRRLVVVLHLEGSEDHPLLCGGLLRVRVRR